MLCYKETKRIQTKRLLVIPPPKYRIKYIWYIFLNYAWLKNIKNYWREFKYVTNKQWYYIASLKYSNKHITLTISLKRCQNIWDVKHIVDFWHVVEVIRIYKHLNKLIQSCQLAYTPKETRSMHSYVPIMYLQYIEAAPYGFALNRDTTSIIPYHQHLLQMILHIAWKHLEMNFRHFTYFPPRKHQTVSILSSVNIRFCFVIWIEILIFSLILIEVGPLFV